MITIVQSCSELTSHLLLQSELFLFLYRPPPKWLLVNLSIGFVFCVQLYLQIAILACSHLKSLNLGIQICPTPALNFTYFHRDKFDKLNKGWRRIERQGEFKMLRLCKRVFQNVVFQSWFLHMLLKGHRKVCIECFYQSTLKDIMRLMKLFHIFTFFFLSTNFKQMCIMKWKLRFECRSRWELLRQSVRLRKLEYLKDHNLETFSKTCFQKSFAIFMEDCLKSLGLVVYFDDYYFSFHLTHLG